MIVIKKFSSEWCVPCKRYDPILDKVVSGFDDVDLERIDIEEEPKLAAAYGVQSVPFTVFEDDEGNVFGGVVGLIREKELREAIERFRGEINADL